MAPGGAAARQLGTHVRHELLADGADLLGQRGAEHHDLLVVRRHFKDVLHVSPHVCTQPDTQLGSHCLTIHLLPTWSTTSNSNKQIVKLQQPQSAGFFDTRKERSACKMKDSQAVSG